MSKTDPVADKSKSERKYRNGGQPLSSLLRVPTGLLRMSDFDASATPGFPGSGREDAEALTRALTPEFSDLQERLFANGRSRPETAPTVLLVLQGVDTCGKGGVIRHAIGLVDPQGVQVKHFTAPTATELAHDFLWRVRKALPSPGMIGIFDRSHYEDVLVARVERLASAEEIESRYDIINAFERELTHAGTLIIKCFLNISPEEQYRRLNDRLANPDKHWKFNSNDLVTRSKWGQYCEATEIALERCNTEHAPWYHIPSDNEWYRNWAVAELLREKLESLDLSWPAATFDVAAARIRLTEVKRVSCLPPRRQGSSKPSK